MSGELPAVAGTAGGRGGLFLVIMLLVSGAVGLRWARGDTLPELGAVKDAVQARVASSAELFPERDGSGTQPPPAFENVASLRQHVVVAQPKNAEVVPARAAPGAQGSQVATDLLSRVLPYVTEGGVALLLGLGLGIATKAAAKLLILFIFLAMLGVGYFAQQGVIAVDQVALLDWLQRFVLNARKHQDTVAMLKDKLPAFGSLGVGYLLGLRR
jgi:uncharacterized membrane protein (Fun14 family)